MKYVDPLREAHYTDNVFAAEYIQVKEMICCLKMQVKRLLQMVN